MKEFIRNRVRESLKYSHVIGDASKDKYELSEYDSPMLSLTKDIDVSEEDKQQIKTLSYKDIILDPQNESSPVKIKVSLPMDKDFSPGIALDIQLVGDIFYQIHIALAESLRGLGLGYKIYKAMIMGFGHVYSGKGRRQNKSEVPRIWTKLNNEPGMTCVSNDIADMCVADNTPNKDELLKAIS